MDADEDVEDGSSSEYETDEEAEATRRQQRALLLKDQVSACAARQTAPTGTSNFGFLELGLL